MAITYHAGRRIQGLSTDTVETITFSDNSFTSGWDKAGTQIATNSGSGEIDWNARVNGTNHSLVHDLQDELGSGVYLSTKYVARFEITIDVIQSGGFSGGNNINFGFSGSDESVGYDGTSQDFHGIKLSHDGGGSGSYIIKHVAVNNSGIGAGTSFAETFTTQTYYVELVRDGDDFTTKLLDSNYSVLTEEESTTVTNIQLQYFKITEDDGFSSSANFSGTVDNIKIWNGVTSISSKPSNVQVGSRFEETDTRKMYNFTDPLTFEDDFSSDNWTDKGSMGVSGGTLTGANVLDGGDDTSYYDLTSTSDTNWILRFKGTYTTTYGTGNASKLLYVGLSSDINAQNTAKDFAGFIFEQWNLPQFKISGGVVNNATLEYASSLSNLNALNTSSATTVTNYFEIKRDNDNFTFTVYSNSDYTGQLATVTRTVSSVTTLRYLVLTNRDSSASNTGSLTVSVDDLNFYNGVTSTSNYWQEIGA
jgi:hypothetical protein